MTDPFARTTASHAHQRATEAHTLAQKLEHTVTTLRELVGDRPKPFRRRCALCGEPCKGRYCKAHDWAAG